MPIHANKTALWTETSGVSSTTTSSTTQVRSSHLDDTTNENQSFGVLYTLTASGGTSPTVDCKVDHSWDGTNWMQLNASSQLSGAGTLVEHKTISGPIGPYLRVVVTPGGTAAPTVTGTVHLTSPSLMRVV